MNEKRLGLLGMIGIGAFVLTLAGVGTYFLVENSRRRSRLGRRVSRAGRVLTRNLEHAAKRARARVDHFPS